MKKREECLLRMDRFTMKISLTNEFGFRQKSSSSNWKRIWHYHLHLQISRRIHSTHTRKKKLRNLQLNTRTLRKLWPILNVSERVYVYRLVGLTETIDLFVQAHQYTNSVAFRRRSMPFSVDEVEQFKVETIQMLFIRYESKTQQ